MFLIKISDHEGLRPGDSEVRSLDKRSGIRSLNRKSEIRSLEEFAKDKKNRKQKILVLMGHNDLLDLQNFGRLQIFFDINLINYLPPKETELQTLYHNALKYLPTSRSCTTYSFSSIELCAYWQTPYYRPTRSSAIGP